jgi:hypothetical protein
VEAHAGTRHHGDDQLPASRVSHAACSVVDGYLPAADSKEDERETPKHRVDAEIVSEALIWMLLVVLSPKLNPYCCGDMVSMRFRLGEA